MKKIILILFTIGLITISTTVGKGEGSCCGPFPRVCQERHSGTFCVLGQGHIVCTPCDEERDN